MQKRYKEAARDEIMTQWSVPQYARYLSRRASSTKCKTQPPAPEHAPSLSASWPNQTPSRSVNFLPSSSAPSLCAVRSADGSARGSGAWWEAVIAGTVSADAVPSPAPAPAASPGASRSPAASRMISRVLSVLPELTDELAHTQSLMKSGTGSFLSANAQAAPRASEPGTTSGLARAPSSEMTIVRGEGVPKAAPPRYAASPLVNLHSDQVPAAPLSRAADHGRSADGGGSSAGSGKGSSAASSALVPTAGLGAAGKRGPATVAPTDPRLGRRSAGGEVAGGPLPPTAVSRLGIACVPEPLFIQQFDSVFSEALPTNTSGQSGTPPTTVTTVPPAEGGMGVEASSDTQCMPGGSQESLGLYRQHPTGSTSNGSLNFMYSLHGLSQDLVVNREGLGPPKMSAQDAKPAAAGGMRGSLEQRPPCRQFLQGQARPGTPESSAVSGDSGTGQEEQSGSTSAELSAVARQVASEWRGNACGRSAGKEGSGKPSRRLLQRSAVIHKSQRHHPVACAERAVAASRDPAWCAPFPYQFMNQVQDGAMSDGWGVQVRDEGWPHLRAARSSISDSCCSADGHEYCNGGGCFIGGGCDSSACSCASPAFVNARYPSSAPAWGLRRRKRLCAALAV